MAVVELPHGLVGVDTLAPGPCGLVIFELEHAVVVQALLHSVVFHGRLTSQPRLVAR